MNFSRACVSSKCGFAWNRFLSLKSYFHSLLASHAEEILGQRFQLGVWSTFLIPAKFHWFILFCTLLATFFKLYKMFPLTEYKEAPCLLEKFIRQQHFFFFFIFGDIFLGAHNVWTLPFPVWMRPSWFHVVIRNKNLNRMRKYDVLVFSHLTLLRLYPCRTSAWY